MKPIEDIEISANKLCDLTGLTDRRHRQLAEEGFFPKPKESVYNLWQTIQGYIKFLKSAKSPALERLNEARLVEQERKNRVAEKVEAEQYMPTERAIEIFQLTIKSLDLIPAKMASEFGWTSQQERRMLKLIDEAREEIVKEIKKTEQKEPANESV